MPINLLEYTENQAETLRLGNSRRKKNFTDCDRACASLRLYLRGDEDLMRCIDPEFVMGYGRFLLGDGYRRARQAAKGGTLPACEATVSRLSVYTLVRHLKAFRTVVRSAIRDGLIPAIDVMPGVAARLQEEFGFSDDVLASLIGKEQSAGAPVHNFDADVQKLMALLPADMSSKSRVAKALPALIYLMGIYAYGMEIEDLLELRLDTDEECAADCVVTAPIRAKEGRLPACESSMALLTDHSSTIAAQAGSLPTLMTVTLPERALRIADVLNTGIAPDGYLIRRREAWAGKSTREIAEAIGSSIARLTRTEGIGLYRGGSIFSDWLCMLRADGASDALILSLAKGEAVPCDAAALMQMGDRLLAHRSLFRKRWHILCSYNPRLESTEMRAEVARRLKQQGIRFDKARESYDPRSIEKRLVHGKVRKRNNTAISRYLFVYCTADTARVIDKIYPRASLMRLVGDHTKFATVKHREVIDMVNFLRDFRDDVQLVDIEVPGERRTLSEGVKVRILTGPFAGFEGTIAQVLGLKAAVPSTAAADAISAPTDEEKRLYQVEVTGFRMSASARVTIPGLEIEATG